MRTAQLYLMSAAVFACAVITVAQTSEPTPLTMSPPPAATSAKSDGAKEQAELAANIRELQDVKAQNDEILKQQQATLDTLEQLEKDADQIRIFSKRG